MPALIVGFAVADEDQKRPVRLVEHFGGRGPVGTPAGDAASDGVAGRAERLRDLQERNAERAADEPEFRETLFGGYGLLAFRLNEEAELCSCCTYSGQAERGRPEISSRLRIRIPPVLVTLLRAHFSRRWLVVSRRARWGRGGGCSGSGSSVTMAAMQAAFQPL
jgi:hypothetical protein